MAHSFVEFCFSPAAGDDTDGARDRERSEARVPRDVSRVHDLATLAVRVRDGDEGALEQLFRAMYARLVRFAAATVDGDSAADVVADVFITVWNTRRTWDPTDVEAFLYRAVRNRALNHIRGDARELRRRDAYQQLGSAHTEPLQLVEEDDRTAAVRAAVGELNARQRELVILRWQEGRTPAEIAVLLETTTRAVTSLQDRTLAMLRRRAPELLVELKRRG